MTEEIFPNIGALFAGPATRIRLAATPKTLYAAFVGFHPARAGAQAIH